MQAIFVTSTILYVAGLFALAWWSRGRIQNSEDFIVAGRRLSFPLATATLFATWFGAGTMLAAADQVAISGLRVTVLEPYGAALCLILAGTFYARTMWERKLCTIQDYFGQRFGVVVERIAALYSLSYLGWIATQLVGCAGILEVFAGVPLAVSIILIAAVATAYTMLGGMWSVAITDAFQLVFIVIGVVILSFKMLVLVTSSDVSSVSTEAWQLLPEAKAEAVWQWVGLLLAGSVGILASQDLFQRVFSARAANTARHACLAAGALYAVIGTLPVMIGLLAPSVLAESAEGHIVAHLARQLLDPWITIPFMFMVLSAVLSTLDSALLAPATVLARNFIAPLLGERVSTLFLTRICILGFGLASTVLALSGEEAFSMLESSYAMGAAPWVVLTAGLWLRARAWPAVITLLAGLAFWLIEMAGWNPTVPPIIWVLVLGALVVTIDRVLSGRGPM